MGDSGDQNIGGIAYDNNANKLYLRANDNYYLTIKNQGEVGIGTTDPNKTLEVRYVSTSTDVTAEGLSGAEQAKGY